MSQDKVTGYKGFNEKFQCTPEGKIFQYEVGKTFVHDGTVKLCDRGFHFVENPLSVFGYYPPANSRFAEVEGLEVSDETESDSKRVAKELYIKAEVSLTSLIHLGVKFILDKVDWSSNNSTNTGYRSAATNTGNYSAATNTGYQSAATNTGDRSAATNTGYQSAATNTGNYSAATNTGDRSAATNTGDRSAATNTGKEGCAISLGIEGRAKASLGCWITLAEWERRNDGWHRIDVQTKKVDGKRIKADTFYVLTGGKFKEVVG